MGSSGGRALALALVGAPALTLAAVAQTDASGRYDFAAVSQQGDSLHGTIHLVHAGDRLLGRVLTDIRPELRIQRVVVDSAITVVTEAVRFRWRQRGDSLIGQWRIGDTRGDIRGRRLPREPNNDLRPVPCRVARLRELVRCATHFVPEDADRPHGRLIPINLVILPRTAGGSTSSALFLFAGGPGQASTDGAAANAARYSAIRRTRDVVMADQRGTGGSNGLYCQFESVEERAAALFGGFFPAAATSRCAAELAERADLRLYHTEIAAGDVERVRRWLGYERLDLYGGSYGTRAALAFLRAYPERVRTVTLRGIIAPSGSLVRDNPGQAQAALEQLFRDCAAESGCHAAFPDLGGDFQRVMDRLDRDPVTVLLRDPAGGDSVSFQIDHGVFAGSVRRMLMDAGLRRRLPLAIHDAASGRFEVIRVGVEQTVAVAGSLAWGMGLSVVCAEDPPMLQSRDLGALTAGTFLGRRQSDGVRETCGRWPAGTPSAGYDQPVRSAVPALLISGAVDPTTPPAWGAEVARALPNGAHLVLPGIAHSPFPDCALGIMAAFVERGSMAGVDTGCVDAMAPAPFVTAASR